MTGSSSVCSHWPCCSVHYVVGICYSSSIRFYAHCALGSVVGSGNAYSHTNKDKNEPLSALKERFGYYESL